MKGRVLSIAGSDSGGGAGIQADIKTVTMLDGFAASAITALTAQNTQGVFAIQDVPTEFISQQIRVVLEDIGADCVKTGMLHTAAVIEVVVDTYMRHAPNVPLVVDPVMIAKGGAALLAPDAHQALVERLVPFATVLTPNLPEAESLLGEKIVDAHAMSDAALALRGLGPKAVLLKGGHLPGDSVVDVLVADGVRETFRAPRIDSRHTHGTGCTMASAIATGLAQGMDLVATVERARRYVRAAIETAPELGTGHGPLNHAHPLEDGRR